MNIEMVKVGLAEVCRGNPAKDLDMNPYWKAEQKAKKVVRHERRIDMYRAFFHLACIMIVLNRF